MICERQQHKPVDWQQRSHPRVLPVVSCTTAHWRFMCAGVDNKHQWRTAASRCVVYRFDITKISRFYLSKFAKYRHWQYCIVWNVYSMSGLIVCLHISVTDWKSTYVWLYRIDIFHAVGEPYDAYKSCYQSRLRFMLNAWLCACYKFWYYYYYYYVLSENSVVYLYRDLASDFVLSSSIKYSAYRYSRI